MASRNKDNIIVMGQNSFQQQGWSNVFRVSFFFKPNSHEQFAVIPLGPLFWANVLWDQWDWCNFLQDQTGLVRNPLDFK